MVSESRQGRDWRADTVAGHSVAFADKPYSYNRLPPHTPSQASFQITLKTGLLPQSVSLIRM